MPAPPKQDPPPFAIAFRGTATGGVGRERTTFGAMPSKTLAFLAGLSSDQIGMSASSIGRSAYSRAEHVALAGIPGSVRKG